MAEQPTGTTLATRIRSLQDTHKRELKETKKRAHALYGRWQTTALRLSVATKHQNERRRQIHELEKTLDKERKRKFQVVSTWSALLKTLVDTRKSDAAVFGSRTITNE